jgi:hypothetical protein
VTITGGGASTTIIDGNSNTRPNAGVLAIFSGAISISGVTIRNGVRAGRGGGIKNVGSLTLIAATVRSNTAGVGGGIDNEDTGILTLINSTVSGNATQLEGGGIYNEGTVTLINSTVSGNNAGDGGGIFNTDNPVTLKPSSMILANSTVDSNTATTNGGGIFIERPMTLINSTVSGNNAGQSGGGIYINLGATANLNLFNTTIANNQADADFNGTGTGGGVYVQGTLAFQNTIIAVNFETLAVPTGVPGVFNHIPVPGDCTGIINSSGNNIMLAPNCTVNGPFPLVADPLSGLCKTMAVRLRRARCLPAVQPLMRGITAAAEINLVRCC